MFLHKHPYAPFIPENATKLIVGTLPPPRFSKGELLERDVDFCYGSCYNSLWLYIEKIHGLNLKYNNSKEAIDERKAFLNTHGIGICDIVDSAERDKIDASDLGMNNVVLRDIIGYLKKYPKVETLLFIGGNSKNGPEYFFRRHLKSYNLKLKLVDNTIPRIHEFELNCHSQLDSKSTEISQQACLLTRQVRNDDRTIKTVSLTSSSGAANRSIGSNAEYKRLKAENPKFTTFDFRVRQYSRFI